METEGKSLWRCFHLLALSARRVQRLDAQPPGV